MLATIPMIAKKGRASYLGERSVGTQDPGATSSYLLLKAAADTWAVLERQGRTGALVETWVTSELRKLLTAAGPGIGLWYWRPHAGREVDFLIEHGESLVAVEVKWSQRISETDISGLRQCAQDLKRRVRLSILLYPGTDILALDTHTLAVPFSVFFGVD